jgi:UDP-N-acetylmuramate dehydrogenase
MNIRHNVPLAPYTSFEVGGIAENFIEVQSANELVEVLQSTNFSPIHIIGYGSNTLVADGTIQGLVICTRGGSIQFSDTLIIADAGVWWDDLVRGSIDRGLWGIELMSEIPGSVGAALYINITAYGQTIGPRVEWIEVWDPHTKEVLTLDKSKLLWDYKSSIFQKPQYSSLVILRAAFNVSHTVTDELLYQKAIDVAQELSLDTTSLADRRKIISEARMRAGSIWQPNQKHAKTAGSFFRNPLVDQQLADLIMQFDESGKTMEQIKLMNKVHGGDTKRVSAAHVLLASGFNRGQTWGNVKLNDQNLLKIEALEGATAQDIYKVAKHMQDTVFDTFGITLEPEVELLGFAS